MQPWFEIFPQFLYFFLFYLFFIFLTFLHQHQCVLTKYHTAVKSNESFVCLFSWTFQEHFHKLKILSELGKYLLWFFVTLWLHFLFWIMWWICSRFVSRDSTFNALNRWNICQFECVCIFREISTGKSHSFRYLDSWITFWLKCIFTNAEGRLCRFEEIHLNLNAMMCKTNQR